MFVHKVDKVTFKGGTGHNDFDGQNGSGTHSDTVKMLITNYTVMTLMNTFDVNNPEV